MEYKKILDKFFKHFNEDPYTDEITVAKDEYFEKIGRVFEDDSFFEMRMAAFFEWFAFERPIKKIGLPPVKIYCQSNESSMNDEEKSDYESLMKTIWSIYLVKKKKEDFCELLDLYDKKKYRITMDKEFYLPDSSTVVEARLIKFRDNYYLSDPIFTHPKEVSRKIKKAAKKYRKANRPDFQELILKLAQMSIKSQRYKHLALKEIYKFK